MPSKTARYSGRFCFSLSIHVAEFLAQHLVELFQENGALFFTISNRQKRVVNLR